jgi:hypothetical protein
MADTPNVDNILKLHKGIPINDGVKEYPHRSNTEWGEIVSNLDDRNKTNFNTRINAHERNCLLIIDHCYIKQLKLWDDMEVEDQLKFTADFKELSVSLAGAGRDDKVKIATGLTKSRTGGGFMELMKRQDTPPAPANPPPK